VEAVDLWGLDWVEWWDLLFDGLKAALWQKAWMTSFARHLPDVVCATIQVAWASVISISRLVRYCQRHGPVTSRWCSANGISEFRRHY
jgi:hypothetical protein